MATENLHDDNDLRDLTDEERESLQEDTTDEGEGDTPEDTAKDDETPVVEDEPDSPSRDDGEGEGEPDQTDKELNKESGNEQHRPAPILVAEAPIDVANRLKEIESKREELIELFDNGDLSTREYHTATNQLNNQELEIKHALFKSELAADIQRQREFNEWMSEVDRFKRDETITGGVYLRSQRALQALDSEVRAVASKPENQHLSGREVLEQAHRTLAEEFGWVDGTPPASKAPSAAAAKKVKHPAPPPTLGRLPAAEMNDNEGGKFAKLDKLKDTDPLAYEEACEKLTDAQRAEYLKD